MGVSVCGRRTKVVRATFRGPKPGGTLIAYTTTVLLLLQLGEEASAIGPV